MGGGNRIRSACTTIAIAKAHFGNLWSIQQSRKYGPPRNSFGGAGPRTSAIRLVENSLSRPVLPNASRGAGNSVEESNEMAKLVLSCKWAISSKRNGPPGNYTPSERSGAGFSLWVLVVSGREVLVTNQNRLKFPPPETSDAAWLNEAASKMRQTEVRPTNGLPFAT